MKITHISVHTCTYDCAYELLQYFPTSRLNFMYLAPHQLVYEYEGSIVSTLEGEVKRVRSHTC